MKFWGVFCNKQFISLWQDLSGPTAGIPCTELTGPILIRSCPGCQKDHVFQPADLKLSGPLPAQQLHDFETLNGV